ncbi:hypothetical protein SAMN04244572_04131 [Azotobacter beijerinckii]|uniref:Uncharacterized protein n=1 Tax=Azotobacter beijerinckii TaxID=170623 RepID=A0A1H6ZCG2_9GAMM|nr:hypothetical protein [Azotobacter beijerinckii]SEJ47200.1 hypothetical protein SAMN04244572_04131 [Azotobacter beijerinckii]
MPTDLQTLQGEIVALRCSLAALLSSLPQDIQQQTWPTFERLTELMRDQLPPAGAAAFDRAVTSLTAFRE